VVSGLFFGEHAFADQSRDEGMIFCDRSDSSAAEPVESTIAHMCDAGGAVFGKKEADDCGAHVVEHRIPPCGSVNRVAGVGNGFAKSLLGLPAVF
jgi:hypothetical protein